MVRARSPQANRTDLVVPNQQAPAETYGERQQQQAAQRAVPIAQPASAAPVPSTGGPPGGIATTQGTPALPTGPAGGAGQGSPPVSGPAFQGTMPWLHPTNRPNEPLTAGLATGAGPGPEVMTGAGAVAANQSVEQGTLRNLLSSLANGPTSSAAVRDLASVASGGQ